MMPRTLIECTEMRKGERLVQGVLLFLLTNDQPFRRAFCEWAGWPRELRHIAEEKREGAHRHDLYFEFDDGSKRNLELKLWAGPTERQSADPESIDLFLVPERYQSSGCSPFPAKKLRHWEDFKEAVVKRSPFAQRLLQGFDTYAWTGGSIERRALKTEVELWWAGKDCEWRGTWFLRGCADCAAKLGLRYNLSARLRRADRLGYWGYYLKSSRFPEKAGFWLWFGFIFQTNDHNSVEELELILQVPRALEARLGMRPVIPAWYKEDWGKTGVSIDPVDDQYTVAGWWEKCETCIRQYLAGKATS
jgi:hypothetical protein